VHPSPNFALIAVTMSSYNLTIPGLPKDTAVSLDDFSVVAVSLELASGRLLDGSLVGIVEDQFVLDDGYGNTIEARLDDVKSFLINATESCWPDWTTVVPVSWVNRLVSVKLPHGEICGLFGFANLGADANDQLHISTLPGSPVIPPLPYEMVQGVALVSRALFASVQTSGDGKWMIYRSFLQAKEQIATNELHIPTDLPEENQAFHLGIPNDDFVLVHWLDMKVYRNSYVVAGAKPCQYKFIRFPYPVCNGGKTAAQSRAFQMQWLPEGMPDLGEEHWYVHEIQWNASISEAPTTPFSSDTSDIHDEAEALE